jgi:hypothetical protein
MAISMTDFKLKLNSLSFDFELENEELYDFHRIWESKRDGRNLPSRSQLDPIELKRHLGWLLLVDVEREPVRFRFRLVGTNIATVSGRDVTGKYFEEVYGSGPSEIKKFYEMAFEGAKPCHVVGRFPVAGRDFYRYEALLVPLADNGSDVDKIMTRSVFHNA